MSLTPWKIVSSQHLIRDAWMQLRADRCLTDKGTVLDPYYVLEPRDWVQVVAFDDEGRILITRQYRHGAKIISTELPCGTVEAGESPLDAVQRELSEETGCEAGSMQALPAVSPNPACYANWIYPFLATGVRQVKAPMPDESEQIEFEFLSVSQVLSLIDAGEFSQALHIGTLFLALRSRGILVAR